MLVPHQNLMNVIRMCRASGEVVFQNLKDVPEASRVVNIDIGHALVALHEKSKLEISVFLGRLETPRVCVAGEL